MYYKEKLLVKNEKVCLFLPTVINKNTEQVAGILLIENVCGYVFIDENAVYIFFGKLKQNETKTKTPTKLITCPFVVCVILCYCCS